VEIACPTTCGYLAVAASHPPAVVKRRQERDLALVVPVLEGLSDGQSKLLSLVCSVIAHHRPVGFAVPKDADVVDGVSALLATYETSRRGVIYEHRADTLPGQRIMSELTALFGEAAKEAGRPVDDDALLALDRTKRLAESARKASPDSDTAFLELVRRIAGPGAAEDARRDAGRSPIIVP
jgi:hypothetical protein